MNPLLSLLPQIQGQSSWQQAADEDRFEGYVFALALSAAQKEGGTVRFENNDGQFGSVATFRTASGHIWSQAQPYTHAVIESPTNLSWRPMSRSTFRADQNFIMKPM